MTVVHPCMYLVRLMRLRAYVNAIKRGARPTFLGSLGTTRPLSDRWGFDRGRPVDRWYIDRFIRQHKADITGRVLEVEESEYTNKFGQGVTEPAVLDVDPNNPRATIVADLQRADVIPEGHFDCFILTQTLQLIPDVRAALRHARRVLRPGGVLLTTVPVTSKVCEPPHTDHWRWTPLGFSLVMKEVFPDDEVTVRGHGNVLSSIAFLKGMAAEELLEHELAEDDERFPLVVCARAVKAA